MVLWSLYRTANVNPGYIQTNTLYQCNTDFSTKLCLGCNIVKPERAHHCSKCRRCVLNMDHHCVWTSNCIGLYNRKYFNLILIWGSLGMIQATLLSFTNVPHIYATLSTNIGGFVDTGLSNAFMADLRRIFTLFMIASQFFNAIGLYYFTWKNMWLVLTNMTTLDKLILESNDNQRDYSHLYQYNLGIRYNFQFYFGNNPLLWLLPIGTPLGNGHNWDSLNLKDQELSEDRLIIS